jgi:hypothetical protein
MSDKTSLTADYANRTDLVTTSDLTTFNNTNSGIIAGTTQNSTSGAIIDFTSIPSWVKRITISFSGVSTNGSSNLLVQLGTTSGIESSNYKGGASVIATAVASTTLSSGFNLYDNSSAASYIRNGSLTLSLINANSNIWGAFGAVGEETVGRINITAGSKALSGVLDRIRITTVNGTDQFDAGQIGLLYE